MTHAEQSPDVVVIGGGIVGCATAYYLAEAGLRVHLVERDGVATGTSGCCMGHLMVTPDPEFSYHLTRRSVLLWQRLAAELGGGGGFEYNPSGAFWLAETDEDLPLLEQLVTELERHGDRGEIIDGDELCRREPGLARGLPGAMYYADDGVVMPMLAAGALLEAAMRRGAKVSWGRPVTGFLMDGDRMVGVRTEQGDIRAAHVVNAAGVWSAELTERAGLPRAPVYPRRGDLAITMHHTSPVHSQLLEVAYLRVSMSGGGKAASPLEPDDDPGAHAVNIQPQSKGSVLIGSTRQFQRGYDRVVNRDLLRTSLTRAARYLPGLERAAVVRTWAGLRPFALDKKPILGPCANLPGFHMATGHEGLGITMAPITGRLVTQAILGETPDLDLAPYALSRFAEVPHG